MGGMPPVNQVQPKSIFWKVAFSITALIIISLLCILIYLQLYPYQQTKVTIQPTEEVNVAPAEPKIDTTLVKMTFETKPIPVVKEETKVTQAPSKVKKAPVQSPQKSIEKTEQPIIVTSQTTTVNNTLDQNSGEMAELKTQLNPNIEEEADLTVNYDEISEDLKKRFELAVMLTEQEENSVDGMVEDDFVEENSDGSDIHLMSSNFQNQIPVMRYDSHVYSSVVADRWIRINGERLVEGSFDSTGKLEVIEIQPQRSIFRFGRQSFSLESLTDWKGY